ncbi:hypothetical protein BLNAU_9694 [Blattamonas nauphoetae]|uniref:Homeobox domain-containing protein n=1 Tax=Blattamonas nauphoetae TaxID=2049346 RepID=A0ABQ9XUZ3_9EUKA|nr:hypothetical protein BLNAU_9694 [Blattamonas nauphoetae]
MEPFTIHSPPFNSHRLHAFFLLVGLPLSLVNPAILFPWFASTPPITKPSFLDTAPINNTPSIFSSPETEAGSQNHHSSILTPSMPSLGTMPFEPYSPHSPSAFSMISPLTPHNSSFAPFSSPQTSAHLSSPSTMFSRTFNPSLSAFSPQHDSQTSSPQRGRSGMVQQPVCLTQNEVSAFTSPVSSPKLTELRTARIHPSSNHNSPLNTQQNTTSPECGNASNELPTPKVIEPSSPFRFHPSTLPLLSRPSSTQTQNSSHPQQSPDTQNSLRKFGNIFLFSCALQNKSPLSPEQFFTARQSTTNPVSVPRMTPQRVARPPEPTLRELPPLPKFECPLPSLVRKDTKEDTVSHTQPVIDTKTPSDSDIRVENHFFLNTPPSTPELGTSSPSLSNLFSNTTPQLGTPSFLTNTPQSASFLTPSFGFDTPTFQNSHFSSFDSNFGMDQFSQFSDSDEFRIDESSLSSDHHESSEVSFPTRNATNLNFFPKFIHSSPFYAPPTFQSTLDPFLAAIETQPLTLELFTRVFGQSLGIKMFDIKTKHLSDPSTSKAKTKVNQRFSVHILLALRTWYDVKKSEGRIYATKQERILLSRMTHLSITQVTDWISNERNRDPQKVVKNKKKNKMDTSLHAPIPLEKKGLSSRVKVVIFATSMSCIYVAATTALNYMTTFFPDYSAIVLAIYGFSMAILCPFAPLVSNSLSVYIMLCACAVGILSFVGIALFVLILVREGGTTPTVGIVLLFVGALLLGASHCLLWSTWTEYMNMISTDDTRGDISGLFYAIYYVSTPVGNGLSSILFIVGFQKWQVVLVLACFCLLGTVLMFFVPAGQCQKKQKNDQTIEVKIEAKDYLKSFARLVKYSPVYTLVVILLLYYVMNSFLQACFTKTLSEKTGSTFVGIGFAIGGIANIISSLMYGKIVDKVSLRASLFINLIAELATILLAYITIILPATDNEILKVVFFIITITVSGIGQTGIDVNAYILCISLAADNSIAFLQYGRVFGYISYGVISLTSQWLVAYPHIFIILIIALILLLCLLLWNIDIHRVSFSRIPPAAIAEVFELPDEEMESLHRTSSQYSTTQLQRIQSRMSQSTRHLPLGQSTLSSSFVDLPEQTAGQLENDLGTIDRAPSFTSRGDASPAHVVVPPARRSRQNIHGMSTARMSSSLSMAHRSEQSPTGSMENTRPSFIRNPPMQTIYPQGLIRQPTLDTIAASTLRPDLTRPSHHNIPAILSRPSVLILDPSRENLAGPSPSMYFKGFGGSSLAMHRLYSTQRMQSKLVERADSYLATESRSGSGGFANRDPIDPIDEEGDMIADDGAEAHQIEIGTIPEE